ncbi:Uma2 family endonuclease [Steroidobacter sp.]|uniref:Uma2 family endonuclease n=1 Tax=Steroidobacter sp. TaxID=1978227 RepID=UPI002EDB645A
MATNMVISASSDRPSQQLHSPYRFSVEQYYRMAEVGLLARDARTELIEGEICDMPPIGCPHAATVAWLHRQLAHAIGDRAWVVEQYPLRLSRHTEPQPDLMVLRSRRGLYWDAHPTARDALLVIEVSDSSWLYDREVKVPLYASYGVQELWLVDVCLGELGCYRAPHAGSYVEQTSIRAPVSLPVPSLDVYVDLMQLFRLAEHQADHSVS